MYVPEGNISVRGREGERALCVHWHLAMMANMIITQNMYLFMDSIEAATFSLR